ncbi:hypothetical protein [Streptomyces sp. NPDC055400]
MICAAALQCTVTDLLEAEPLAAGRPRPHPALGAEHIPVRPAHAARPARPPRRRGTAAGGRRTLRCPTEPPAASSTPCRGR